MSDAKLLPFLGDPEDLGKVLQFLKTRPTGVTLSEAGRVLDKSLLDPRKFDFYDLLALFSRIDGRLRLNNDGLAFLDGTPTKREEIVRSRIRQFEPYHSLIEWAFHKSGTARVEAAPSTFFRSCEFAGLGHFVVGRRGSKSRIEFEREKVAKYLHEDAESAEFHTATSNGNSSVDQAILMSGDIPALKTIQVEEGMTARREYRFTIPIAGRIASLVWDEPTLAPEHWEKIKRVGDAMFLE
ncbi:MAG: hypothetical protein FD138_4694 [Planctomycetota bacterium]|nr:MAG: hypothetical protein FD138_4694 [Planctomycetota bacterium]